VRRFAESEPGVVVTTKVRKCLFTEDSKDEIDMLALSKQLEDMEKVSMDEDSYLKYVKMKFKYLRRKFNAYQLKLIRNFSRTVTEETENIFDTEVEEALELLTAVRRMESKRKKRMETHKWKIEQTEIFRTRQDNEEVRNFLIRLCVMMEKADELLRRLETDIDEADDAVHSCQTIYYKTKYVKLIWQ
jgi:hypothetical protein